jgi:hypothetical protein
MYKVVRILSGFIMIFCASQSGLAQQAANQSGSAAAYRTTINTYCIGCHNDALKTAGLTLEHSDVDKVGVDGAIWEKVLRKLKARTMPPAGMPRPDEATYSQFASYLESSLDSYASQYPHPGEPELRRLNRTEYVNAVRDLLAVDIKADALLPADNALSGFDNMGAVLTISPLLVEQYVAAARKVRLQALGDPDLHPGFEYYSVSNELMQEDRMSEELPFGSRGGIAFVHHFPLDGEYVIKVDLLKNYRDYIRGLVNKPHQLDVRLDGERLGLFTIGGEKHGKTSQLFSTSAQGEFEQEEYERFADKALEVRFPAKAGKRLVTVTFLKETTLPEDPLYPRHTVYDYSQYKGGEPGVRTVAIGGPFNAKGLGTTASRDKVFVCQPAADDDVKCAEQILTRLAHKAWRRPPTATEMEELLGFYQQGRQEKGFENGIGTAMERILAGPEFLFVAERVPAKTKPDEVFRISDSELATRLSLFLWSSLPDEELLSLAEAGKLGQADVLEQQVARMLEDPRSNAMIDNFAAQWLNLGKLNVVDPDIELFPYFEDNLRQAFQTETKLFFEHIFRNNRPLLELLSADYTFVNERLAQHYGIPDVYGNHFRKVSLANLPRGGLLGQGSILTVTSYANRTAPTIRGKWVLENILSAPPPPPPANVPGLRDRNDDGKVLNMRERMEQHRANPVCASCHKVMDPLGFALENFDAIGKWRTSDSSSRSTIDASGALPDGTAFEGYDGLRKVLLEKRSADFVLTVVEKMLTYALGREVGHPDAPIMREIIRETAPDYQLTAIIKSVVKSTPFLMRRAPDHADL